MDMNTKSVIIDNAATATWYNVRREIEDQVFQINPFWQKMAETGRIKSRVPDGSHFEIPVRYSKLGQNGAWFGRGDTLGAQEKEFLTRLIYETKNYGDAIPRFWDDDRKNRGQAQLVNYIEELIDTTKESMIDSLGYDLLVQNSDPKSMNSISTLVSTTPTAGSIGGLARTSNEYLQNNIKDFSGLTTSANLLPEMRTMVNTCSKWRGGTQQRPDMILTTQAIYEAYEEIAQALQVIQTSKSERASLGFGELAFKNIEMFWDPNCEAGKMYFLNTSALELSYDPSAWFEMTDWKPIQGVSLDKVAQIVCVCNLNATHFRKQGVIFDIPTS